MDRWNSRWERWADRVAGRWYRFQDRWAERRDRAASRWYRFEDRWGERRDRVAERWYGFTDRWADRIADRRDAKRRAVFTIGRFTALAIFTGVAALAIVTTVVLAMNDSEQGGLNAGSNAGREPSIGIPVPDVQGDSASVARRTLIKAGLTLEGVKAVVGAPGRVLDTSPTIGRLVDPTTPVTLIVGVEIERATAVPPDYRAKPPH